MAPGRCSARAPKAMATRSDALRDPAGYGPFARWAQRFKTVSPDDALDIGAHPATRWRRALALRSSGAVLRSAP